MIHFHKRVRFHALAAVAVPGAVLATVANEPALKPATPEQVLLVLGGFVVVVAGAMALAWVRWLNKVEHNVPRDPDRIAEALTSLRDDIRELREDVRSVDRRVARIEGSLEMVVVDQEAR